MPKQQQETKKQVVVVGKTPGTNWARVVFGTLAERTADAVVLKDARQALYYSQKSGGELGLAAAGPGEDSRITAVAPHVEVLGISLFMECTETAAKAWVNAPVFAGAR